MLRPYKQLTAPEYGRIPGALWADTRFFMTFRFLPPAPEEWRAFWVQCGGCVLALFAAFGFPGVRSYSTVLIGVTLGVSFLLFQSARSLIERRKCAGSWRIELSAQQMTIHQKKETVILWRDIVRCEAVENSVQIVTKDGKWEFAPREWENGQALAREVKQRATPGFISLEAK